ncbi:hypothetical protein [Segatella maculosa]|uniref:hypothetical protein n=1 Tax=Segatella maculosa TaxID=439703 RepID=UPI0028D69B94|nr:hypothetical protein [Segatella maculosa]
MLLAKTVWRLLMPCMGEHRKTLTTDNGSEFAEHEWTARRLAQDSSRLKSTGDQGEN